MSLDLVNEPTNQIIVKLFSKYFCKFLLVWGKSILGCFGNSLK